MQNWLHYHCVIILAVYCIQLISENRTLKNGQTQQNKLVSKDRMNNKHLWARRIRKKVLNLKRAGRIRLTQTQKIYNI